MHYYLPAATNGNGRYFQNIAAFTISFGVRLLAARSADLAVATSMTADHRKILLLWTERKINTKK